jgi:uncharacterized protein
MTQPAKVQEPSMEEILASIRRIIADDEAKPPAAVEKPASPPAAAKPPEKPAAAPPATKATAMTEIPPSAIPAAQAAAKVAPPPVKPAAPAAAASNSQDDIDALLNGLDDVTTAEEIRPSLPDGEVFELTDDMALTEPPPAAAAFHKVEPDDDLEFTDTAAARAVHRQPAYEPPPFESAPAPPQQQILSRSTVSAVESAFNTLANTVLSNNARTLEDLVKEMLRPMLKSWLDDNLPGLVERIVKAEIERVSRGSR